MRLARVTFGRSFGNFKPTPEQEALINSALREPLKLSDKGEIDYWTTHVADLELIHDVAILCEGLDIAIKGEEIPLTSLEALTDTLTSKIERMLEKQRSPGTRFNERCQVVVPDIGLLAIRQVEVLDDRCTEDLDKWLEKGWRILAVCPQPDQRRPDYILGRTTREA